MMKKTEVKCETCHFYHGYEEKPPYTPYDGVCRLHPPVTVVIDDCDMSKSPQVHSGAWCGDWQEAWAK